MGHEGVFSTTGRRYPTGRCGFYAVQSYRQKGSSWTEVFQNLRINPRILKTPRKAPGVEFIIQFWGEKLKKICQFFFCGSLIPIKNTFCKKKWPKTVNPALSSDVSILPLTIWGCHCQLDDHHRNPNTNNRDHLVG